MKILMTGFTGRLGTELKKHLELKKFDGDITKPFYREDCDLIIHAAAFTDVTKAETEGVLDCVKVNVLGTQAIVDAYNDVPLVFISSEYAWNPKGIYAMTKLMGERIVEKHPHHLIIRTLFKPNPWPFDMAYEDQYTQGDYVDVIARIISDRVKCWDRKTSQTIYVGTGRKTMLELARRTKSDVIPNKVTNSIIPLDYES